MPGRRKDSLRVFEPENAHEAVQGWALHTTRRRKIHEAEARHLDRLRYLLGTLSTALAAVAGTSAYAAWESDSTNTTAAVVTAVVGISAAVLASILTFLDLGGRAEAHRRSAAAYKRVLRDFEQASGTGRGSDGAIEDEALQRLKAMLDETDAAAPVVPVKRGEKIEQQPFLFVGTADELAPNPSRPADE